MLETSISEQDNTISHCSWRHLVHWPGCGSPFRCGRPSDHVLVLWAEFWNSNGIWNCLWLPEPRIEWWSERPRHPRGGSEERRRGISGELSWRMNWMGKASEEQTVWFVFLFSHVNGWETEIRWECSEKLAEYDREDRSKDRSKDIFIVVRFRNTHNTLFYISHCSTANSRRFVCQSCWSMTPNPAKANVTFQNFKVDQPMQWKKKP